MKGAPTVVESVFCQGPTKVVPFLCTDMAKNHRYPSSHLTINFSAFDSGICKMGGPFTPIPLLY